MAARVSNLTLTKSAVLSENCRVSWQNSTLRLEASKELSATWEANALGGASPTYRELHKIWEATCDDVFLRALTALNSYGLRKSASTKTLKQTQLALRRADDYELSICGTRKCLRYMKVKQTAAQRIATAQLALYPTANSFDAAVHRVKKNWTDFTKRGLAEADESLVWFVVPKDDGPSLKLKDRISNIALPATGMLVRSDGFWRQWEKIGKVVIDPPI